MTKIEELKAAFEASTPGEWKLLAPGARDEGGTERPFGAVIPSKHRIISAEGLSGEEAVANTKFIALAYKMMPELLEAVALHAAREQYMRYECDGCLDMQEFIEEMQGILAGDVCSETLEALENWNDSHPEA